MKLKFGPYFAANVWLRFGLVWFDLVTKFDLGRDSEARFGQDFKFKFSRDTDVWLRF